MTFRSNDDTCAGDNAAVQLVDQFGAGESSAMNDVLAVDTQGRGLYEITDQLGQWLETYGQECNGLLNAFSRHTSASLIICENADSDVLVDLERYMDDLVQDGDSRFMHHAEGPDDMPAHVRSVLTASSLSLPVRHGRLALGNWQGVFLWEHRYAQRRREVALTLLSSSS